MKKYRFLIIRRVFQITIMAIFIFCNYYSFHFFEGNLSSSKVFYIIPMSDPLSMAQIFLAGGIIGSEAIIGLIIVLLIYGILFGRGYCAFVCPINIITDFAALLRKIFSINIQKKLNINRNTKYSILLLSLILSFIFGVAAFELISPISILHRGIIFGMGFGIFAVISVFLLDLFIIKNGFCGYICPLGASYGLIGKYSLLRIKHNKTKCTKCAKCILICPEPQVLDLIGIRSGTINKIDCIKCGRCIEVCNDNALQYGIFDFNKENKK
ncbi:quinol dehydrogenase ferredoxin subunit NapH [Helicobacter sp. MIT 14-3879]|uniref:quinol dehydrogenase ferredoxin subunit NapH n=1 Tax=Helicobacter sp. MIT 14-3879 TaxID=2040649 RepID=UPI000E1FB46C|nr:quinol dehydrogenase ferredoxin subunit NapH [Helicobacter sp. MIT 14-3879]RDU63480.1 quinol dehydrogenase ferredoxin subunit NapH [Helicobacter sp. MIT 14-3879]